MTNDKLKVVSVDKTPGPVSLSPFQLKKSRREEIREEMEALWHKDPSQFDPERDAMQRKRIATTFQAIKESVPLDHILVADLGMGYGALTRLCRDAGATVHAVDIASQAIEKLQAGNMERISALQECLPTTSLNDDTYDLVLCTDLIGYLKPKEYRMAMSELSRIVKPEGKVICSTPLDIDSEDAVEKFVELFETEFDIARSLVSYDYLLLKTCRFFEAPRKWWQASRTRRVIWKPGCCPIAKALKQSDHMRHVFEKISRFFWQQAGVSHVLLIGKRRPLSFPLPKNEIPQEPKKKREVWE